MAEGSVACGGGGNHSSPVRSVSHPVAQLRTCVEVLRQYQADRTPSHVGQYFSSCRPEINAFLEKHTSAAPLDVCVEDLRGACRVERFDTLDALLTRLSFEDAPVAMILYMSDLADWTQAVLVLRSNTSDAHYFVLNPRAGAITECPLLDFDVRSVLSDAGDAKDGYLMWLCTKSKEVEADVESEPVAIVAATPKKPSAAAAKKRPRKKTLANDTATSEESTVKK